MFSKILFPTDFSEAANLLLECLDTFRPLGIEEVVLLHVTDVREAANLCGFDMTYYERHDDLAHRELERRRERLQAMGYACRVVQFHDVPGKGIVHTARDEKCDLILMASHGKTLAREILLGSVSEYTIRHAPVHVLLMKAQVVEESRRDRSHRLHVRLRTRAPKGAPAHRLLGVREASSRTRTRTTFGRD